MWKLEEDFRKEKDNFYSARLNDGTGVSHLHLTSSVFIYQSGRREIRSYIAVICDQGRTKHRIIKGIYGFRSPEETKYDVRKFTKKRLKPSMSDEDVLDFIPFVSSSETLDAGIKSEIERLLNDFGEEVKRKDSEIK